MQRKISSFVALLLLGLLLLTAAGCDRGPRLAPFREDAVVLAFGDSLTYGTGASAGQAYPDVLAGLLGRPVVNAGVPGETSGAGLARLPAMLESHRPSLVILCHGGNDFLRHLDVAETERNLRAMVTLIRSQGADVLLVGVPKPGFGLAVPKFYAGIAAEAKIPFEGEVLLDLLGDNAMKSDLIHPNTTGYRRLAEAIGTLIARAQRG